MAAYACSKMYHGGTTKVDSMAGDMVIVKRFGCGLTKNRICSNKDYECVHVFMLYHSMRPVFTCARKCYVMDNCLVRER